MAGHQWGKDEYERIRHGKVTGNRLRNTKGVCIYPDSHAIIAHINEDGDDVVGSYIYCDKNKFCIHE